MRFKAVSHGASQELCYIKLYCANLTICYFFFGDGIWFLFHSVLPESGCFGLCCYLIIMGILKCGNSFITANVDCLFSSGKGQNKDRALGDVSTSLL